MTDETNKLPEVVFLDVGDTLIRAHPSWAGVYRQGLREAGIDLSEKDLERALLQETQEGAWWNIEDPFEPTEENSWERILAFDAAVLRRAGHEDLPDSAFRKIEDAFARRSAWYVYPGRDALSRRTEGQRHSAVRHQQLRVGRP